MKKTIAIVVMFIFFMIICSCFTFGTSQAQTATTDISTLFFPFTGGMFGLGGLGFGMMGMMYPYFYGGLFGSSGTYTTSSFLPFGTWYGFGASPWSLGTYGPPLGVLGGLYGLGAYGLPLGALGGLYGLGGLGVGGLGGGLFGIDEFLNPFLGLSFGNSSLLDAYSTLFESNDLILAPVVSTPFNNLEPPPESDLYIFTDPVPAF